MPFTDDSATHGMPNRTKHSFTSRVSWQQAERVFHSRSLKTLFSGLATTEECRYTCTTVQECSDILSVAVNFLLMSFLHALDQNSVTRTKNFLSRPQTPTKFNLHTSHIGTHCSTSSRILQDSVALPNSVCTFSKLFLSCF